MNQTPKEIYDEYKTQWKELKIFESSIPQELKSPDIQAAFVSSYTKLESLIQVYGALLAHNDLR